MIYMSGSVDSVPRNSCFESVFLVRRCKNKVTKVVSLCNRERSGGAMVPGKLSEPYYSSFSGSKSDGSFTMMAISNSSLSL